jgi:uncharacterized protein Veg
MALGKKGNQVKLRLPNGGKKSTKKNTSIYNTERCRFIVKRNGWNIKPLSSDVDVQIVAH